MPRKATNSIRNKPIVAVLNAMPQRKTRAFLFLYEITPANIAKIAKISPEKGRTERKKRKWAFIEGNPAAIASPKKEKSDTHPEVTHECMSHDIR
jgi:hypothetical protein